MTEVESEGGHHRLLDEGIAATAFQCCYAFEELSTLSLKRVSYLLCPNFTVITSEVLVHLRVKVQGFRQTEGLINLRGGSLSEEEIEDLHLALGIVSVLLPGARRGLVEAVALDHDQAEVAVARDLGETGKKRGLRGGRPRHHRHRDRGQGDQPVEKLLKIAKKRRGMGEEMTTKGTGKNDENLSSLVNFLIMHCRGQKYHLSSVQSNLKSHF